MKLTGGKTPSDPSQIPGALQEHAAVCLSEGLSDVSISSKPISYKTLVKQLETKGLIKPLTAARSAPPVDPALSGEHRKEV